MFNHRAQIKYILPEAVQIEKIPIHDEKTKCMKSDMKITLLFDIVKDHDEVSVFVALSNVFSSRLRDFIFRHPEACDVPEAALPDPFTQRSITVKEDSISKDLPTLCETEISNSSHLPPSFRPHFYQKCAIAEMEKSDILSPVKSACEVNGVVETVRSPPGFSSTTSTSPSTPMKPLAGSDSALVKTPVRSTPMRPISPTSSVLTCEDENNKTGSQKGKQSISSAKKSLYFCREDGEDTILSHKQISVCAFDLVLLIRQIFQSVNYCPITKEELVQKIFMYKLEFYDPNEVQTHMENLGKLVPEWFRKKMTPSGDLYIVNEVWDPNFIREKLNFT